MMSQSNMMEREVKLAFDSPDTARAAVRASGAAPLRRRRLQADVLLDTDEGSLRIRRCALRVREEPDRNLVTFKGPMQASRMKLRPEIETTVEDAPALLRMLEELGFRAWFRYEKYREEFQLPDTIVAVDETPIGTFVELEGTEAGIDAAARALGRKPDDYVVDSYRTLFERRCQQLGVPATDMVFGPA
jgi:adenylate cyclase, class 2